MRRRSEVDPDAHGGQSMRPGRRIDLAAWETPRMHRTAVDALLAGIVAAVVTGLLTPVTARVAERFGAVDQPRDRGLSDRPTPLLGGIAIFFGVAVSMAIWLLGGSHQWTAILWGALIITVVGAHRRPGRPATRSSSSRARSAPWLPPVLSGVDVDNFTLPFVHRVDLGGSGGVAHRDRPRRDHQRRSTCRTGSTASQPASARSRRWRCRSSRSTWARTRRASSPPSRRAPRSGS